MTDQGHIFILVGPSGVGKNTLLEGLLEQMPELTQIPTVTTRSPRVGEIEGQHRFFVSDGEFDRLIKVGAFIEWRVIHEEWRYGTLRSTIEQKISSGGDYILEIDILGALTLKQLYPDNIIVIFIYPPSMQALEHRIRNRGFTSDEELAVRLSRAHSELSLATRSDYVVINDDLEEATTRLKEIVQSRHLASISANSVGQREGEHDK